MTVWLESTDTAVPLESDETTGVESAESMALECMETTVLWCKGIVWHKECYDHRAIRTLIRHRLKAYGAWDCGEYQTLDQILFLDSSIYFDHNFVPYTFK